MGHTSPPRRNPAAMKTFLLLLLSLACLSGVQSQELAQPSEALVMKPGNSHTLSCQASGFTFSSDGMSWVRQVPGGGLQWIGEVNPDGSSRYYHDSFKDRCTISRDNSKNMVNLQMTNMKTEDTAKYFCARYSGSWYFDIWSQGQSLTVTSAEEKAPSLYPLISCGKSAESTVTIGCLAKNFLPGILDFSWNDKSNTSITKDITTSNPMLVPSGTYMASSQLKVSTISWDNLDSFYCVAKHTKNSKTVKLEKDEVDKTSPPIVTMHAPVREDLNQYDNGTIVCVMSHFSPSEIKVKWLKNYVETTLNTMTDKASAGADGKFVLSSYITVSKKDWNENTVFSCMVEHTASGFFEIRNLSKSEACEIPPAPGTIEVSVVPPTFESMYLNKIAELTCIISNMGAVDGLDASWYKIGSDEKLPTVLENPVLENSVYSVKAIATVCPEEWLKDSFECRVRHPDLSSPKTVILRKDNSRPAQPPMVFVYPPPEEEMKKKETVSLTCIAKAFFPPDIMMKWQNSEGEADARYVVTTKPMKEAHSTGTYIVYSTLTLPSTEEWIAGKSFHCMVGHESLPLQVIQKSIDKTTGKSPHVNVSLVMSDSC